MCYGFTTQAQCNTVHKPEQFELIEDIESVLIGLAVVSGYLFGNKIWRDNDTMGSELSSENITNFIVKWYM